MVPSTRGGRPSGSAPSVRSPASGTDTTAPVGVKLFCVFGALVTVFGLLASFRITAAGGPFTSPGFRFLLLFAGHAGVL